ncbi:hypothetical protein EZS27_027272 [termite gut metagenome]|uniref:Type I restriction modification DNA specificity domain-containing protein n=1 Tax=termite gut metagenome TaxID=433724 RepID=A0A5J4QQJ4_9ZZZZ
MIIDYIDIDKIIDDRRLDPIYFGLAFFNEHNKFPLMPLKSFCIDFQSGFGAGKDDQAIEENGIIQIRPTNIDNEGMLKYDKNVFVPTSLNKTLLEIDDVLFNNTNSQELVGKTAILKEEKKLFFSNHITRIKVNKAKAIPDYLWIILNIYQRKNVFYSICTNWNNQSGVGIELLRYLKVPLPPKEIQQKIVDLYQQAQQMKQAKEQEAKTLLDGIDNYLLKELGIELPENVENERYFEVNISELVGGRLDVSFYRNKFEFISNIYPMFPLSDLLYVNPSVNYNKLSKDDEISFIPMEIIDEKNGTISEQKFIPITKIKGFTRFKENDLIWAKITPCMQNGKSAIAHNLKNGYGCGSTEFYVLRPKSNNILIEYALLILRDKRILNSAKNSFGGSAGQQRVSRGYLKSIKIPLPPIQNQQHIIDHIQSIQAMAKQLQKEVGEILEKAKKEMEKEIEKAEN